MLHKNFTHIRTVHLPNETAFLPQHHFSHRSVVLFQILNALTSEVLEHEGSFRSPSDQVQFISRTLKERERVNRLLVFSFTWSDLFYVIQLVLAGSDFHVYLIVHNIDGPMLRGEKTQSALGQLASLPNLHLVASIDHINAPLGELRQEFSSAGPVTVIAAECLL